MAERPMLYPDSTIEGSDWIKARRWDLPGVTDLDAYLATNGLDRESTRAKRFVRHSMTLPFWQAAPAKLREQAQTFVES